MASTNEHNIARYQFALDRLDEGRIEREGALVVREGQKLYHSRIHETATVGEGTIIRPGATIGPNVTIGKNCLIKAGARIGERGFSFGFSRNNKPVAISHTGRVVIGDNCSIGSDATVCRATIGHTTIEDDCQIDDHVHVAHNVVVGKRTCIAAGTTICGSVTIGKCVWIGVNVSIMNKIHVADYTLIGNAANVTKEFERGDILVGNPAKVLRNRMGDFPHE